MNYEPLTDKIRQLTTPTGGDGPMPTHLRQAWAELERVYRVQYEQEYGELSQRYPFFHELDEQEQATMVRADIGVAVQAVSPWRRQMLADGERVIGQALQPLPSRRGDGNGRSR